MKVFSLLAISIILTSASLAQKPFEWKQATSAGFTYKYVTGDPMHARFYTLKNGLTVILSPDDKTPRVAVKIAVRTGSNNDPKNHTGLAHYLEHLLFKGTDKFGSLDWAKEKPLLDSIDNLYELYNSTTDVDARKQIYKQIDKVSGVASGFAIANEYDKMMASIGSQRTNAHTFVEETVYEEDIPSNAIGRLMTIQSERFRDPIFRIFHTELEAVYEEKNRGLDNDGTKMQEAMLSNIFPTSNYGQQSTIGTIEHLKNPSLKAIRDYYYKYYIPNNLGIVMAGDFNPDVVIKLVDQAFSYMKSKPVEDYKSPVEKPIAGPIVKEVYGPSAESMRILYRTGPANTREAVMVSMLGSVLANGKAGLLDLNLNKQQKVLGASAGNLQFKDYGVFVVLASPKQGQTLEEVKDLLMNQINKLKAGDFDESLLKAIVANAKLANLQALESNDSRAVNITSQFIKNRGTKWDTEVGSVAQMSTISKKELSDFANTLFTDNNYVVVYKRKGEDKRIVKVEKPPITPVQTNAGKQSPYVKAITETPLPKIKPVWLDYTKDLQKGKIGNAEVLYVQNKDNELFRLYYRFDIGNWNNKVLQYAGQYLQFLGTDKYSADEISKQFYQLACNFTIQTGNEETTVTISGLQENFDKAVSLFEYVLHNCKPDAAALEGLKNRLLKTRSNNKLNKLAIASALRTYAAYGPKNPFNFVLSDAEIKSLNAEDLTSMLHGLMTYEHKILYYGPKTLEGLTASLGPIHTMPSTWTAMTAGTKFERTVQTSNQVLFADYDAVQAEIYWIKNLNVYNSKEEALVNMFNGYFGGGMGSIVFQTIRESKALAYSTFAMVQTPFKKEDNYSLVAYVGSQADKMNDAVAGMNELLDDLPRADQNFINSRTSLMKDIETDRVKEDAIIMNYLTAMKKGVDHDLRKDNYMAYSTITLNELSKYHKDFLEKKPYTYCVVASEKRINLDDLKKYGEVHKLGLEELFGY